jgi:hypothetical protein
MATNPTAIKISSEPLPLSGSHPVSASIHSRLKSVTMNNARPTAPVIASNQNRVAVFGSWIAAYESGLVW